MAIDEQSRDKKTAAPSPDANPGPQENQEQQHEENAAADETDGLANKKPEDLTPEELRLMADTMPGEGPVD